MMKAYKGFKPDMTCLGFKYKEGGEYETDTAKVCEIGFHACEHPLDCQNYYGSEDSVYHEVDIDGNIDRKIGGDTKVAATKIKIGARLSIAGIVKASVDYVMSKIKATTGDNAHAATTGDNAHAATTGDCADAATTGDNAHAATTGDCANAATTGDYAHAATTGKYAHAATTGKYAHAATTGDCANAATTGYNAHAATTGDCANAATTGDNAHAATTGKYANAATTGKYANAATTGDCTQAEVKGSESVAVVTGRSCIARGVVGSWLVLTERDGEYNIVGVKAFKIDGEKYKPDTWYTLKRGKVVKAEEGE